MTEGTVQLRELAEAAFVQRTGDTHTARKSDAPLLTTQRLIELACHAHVSRYLSHNAHKGSRTGCVTTVHTKE